MPYQYDIDKDMYELEEARLNANLAIKEIETKYRVKHMVLEASGQLTPEEFLALEEEDSNNESEDKRGVLRKLIDTILEKIRNFINSFKKDKAKWEDIKPDTEIETPVSEEDLRKYIKSGEFVSQKLDKVLETAQGSDMEAYKSAVREYEEATKDSAWMSTISSQLVADDINDETKKSAKRFIVKASIITAAIAVVNKISNTLNDIISLGNDKLPGTIGSLFGKMNANKEEVNKEAQKLCNMATEDLNHMGRFKKLINRIQDKTIKNMVKNRTAKNADATNKELQNQAENDGDGEVDKSKTIFNKKSWDGESIVKWINIALHGNLNMILDRSDPRPGFKDINKLAGYICTDRGLNHKGKLDADTVASKLKWIYGGNKPKEKTDSEYKPIINRMIGAKGARPIFFDLWGINYKKGILFDKFEQYKQFQRDLLKITNSFRSKCNMPEIKWDQSRAFEYIKLICSSDDPTKDHPWEKYIEDKNSNTKGMNTDDDDDDESDHKNARKEFIVKYYKKITSSELDALITKQKDKGVWSDNNYYGLTSEDMLYFPVDKFKDNINSFDQILERFRQKCRRKGWGNNDSDANAIITLAKNATSSNGNIMRWRKSDLNEFIEDANKKHDGGGDLFLQCLTEAGFSTKFAW